MRKFADLLESASSNWRHFSKLGAAILVVQMVFWLIINPYLIQPKSGQFEAIEISDFQITRLNAPDVGDLENAKFSKVNQGDLRLYRTGYYATSVGFSLDEVPADGLAMLTRTFGDNTRIYLNGNLFFGEGQMELAKLNYHMRNSVMHRLPAAMLKQGENKIDTVIAVDTPREERASTPLLGAYKTIENAFGWRKFFLNEGKTISITVGFVLAIFTLVALIRSQKRRFLFWMFALTTSWSLRSLFFLWTEMPLQGANRVFYYSFFTLLLSACWPILVDEWSERPKKWFQMLTGAAFTLGIFVIGYWLYFSGQEDAFTQVEGVLDNLGLAFMAAMLLRLIWHFIVNTEERRYWEAALLIMLALLFALLLISLLLWGHQQPYLGLTQPLFLFAFAIAFFGRNFRLFQSSAQIAELLQEKLNLRESELEAAHAREKQLLVKQAHGDERDRIMRDMHDGIGNSLVSILMMSKLGKAKHSEYGVKVQNVIDEMRLTIDSGDTVGKSLQAVLSVFKKRIVPRAKDAGFEVHWHNELDDEIFYLGPKDGLQIFRIMQEAVTNALKHSAGDTIVVRISPASEKNHDLQIFIADNGKGLSKVAAKGYGLANMKGRAESIGGKLEINGGKNGTSVTLLIKRKE